MPAAMRQVAQDNTPLKCLGTPQDIAAAALYLASPASAWVTGKIIDVNGGADSSVWLADRLLWARPVVGAGFFCFHPTRSTGPSPWTPI